MFGIAKCSEIHQMSIVQYLMLEILVSHSNLCLNFLLKVLDS